MIIKDTRHDTIKQELNGGCLWSGVQAECEPYGLFGDLIRQQPLNRSQARQARQILRPDFKLDIATTEGNMERRVTDLKTVSLGAPSWYKSGERAVDRRAMRVAKEYLDKAKNMDKELRSSNNKEVGGPVTIRLEEYSLVLPLVF